MSNGTTTTAGTTTTTTPPTPSTFGTLGGGSAAAAAPAQPVTIGQIYHLNSSPEEAWDRFLNMLLDQKIFYVTNLAEGALAGGSYDPRRDVFGLVPPPEMTGTETLGNLPHGSSMVEINTPEGEAILLQGFGAETGIDIANMTSADEEAFENWRDLNFAGQAYLYVVAPEEGATGEGFAIVPSYDGSIYGNLSTVEEAIRGLPLDRASMDAFTANLARTDPYKFRALQSTMSLLGYYGENAGNIRWGANTSVDRNAFLWMMGDLLTEHLQVAQYNRSNPDAQMAPATLRSFLDQRYTDHWEQAVRDSALYTDPTSAFEGITADVEAHVTDTVAQALHKMGRVVTQDMKDRIGSAVHELYADGELDAAALLNTDLTGMQSADETVAMVDAWLAAFHGNEEGWQSQIRFGTTGTPSELLRIARGAGVDLTGLDTLIDPSDRHVSMWMDPAQAPTEEQRLAMARWYFTMLLDQNNGDINAAANQYANTIGNSIFADRQFDGEWLDRTVQQARQDPTSFAYQQGIQTLEEQTQERIDIMNNAEARIIAAGKFSDVSSDLGMAAASSVLQTFTPTSRQRKARL